MYNQVAKGLVALEKAKEYDEPVHRDKYGDIFDNESLAFSRPVTIDITRPHNVFCLGETGDTTHGKDDGNKGGQKFMGPAGETPWELVSIKQSHFTVLPVSYFNGDLRFVTIIFAAGKLNPSLALGVDVFAEWDEEDFAGNFAPGKCHPGMSLFDKDGNEIPVLFAASPKSSMTSAILMHLGLKKASLY